MSGIDPIVVGAARRREREGLAREPLEVAVLAHVHDGMRAEIPCQPVVHSEVVVRRREVGVVIDGDRVLAEATRRLHEDDDVAGPDAGRDEFAVGGGVAVDEDLARRLAPVLPDGVAQLGGQGLEVLAVAGGGDAHGLAAQLLLGEPVLVLSARLDEGVDEGAPRSRVGGLAVHGFDRPGVRDLAGRAEVITLSDLDPTTIDMLCLVVIGASATRVTDRGQVWTPRFVR